MQNDQRSGKELSEEWSKHDRSGVLGAAHHFTQSLSREARMRLFEYDAERQKDVKKARTSR
ncbi:MAG TPA: hypothetical protein VJG64_01950 [Candidatus Paceibacterota bacterium]